MEVSMIFMMMDKKLMSKILTNIMTMKRKKRMKKMKLIVELKKKKKNSWNELKAVGYD
jgi:hypothetical protein